MTAPDPPPAGRRTAIDEFGAFTAGMLLFVPVDFAAAASMDTRGSLAVGLTFLAIIVAVAGLLARTQARWVGIGLLTGFALMTLVTGGLCTLFGGNDEYPVGGLLYVAICVVLLPVSATLSIVQRVRRRRPPAPPEP